MGKISRKVLPKRGNRGQTGLKGSVHRSVSRVPVKKTIARDRAQDYHGVDKLEVRPRGRVISTVDDASGFAFYTLLLCPRGAARAVGLRLD